MEIDGATLMHGHQFKWSVTWQPTFPPFTKSLLFFGHSHESGLYHRNKSYLFVFAMANQSHYKKSNTVSMLDRLLIIESGVFTIVTNEQ